jgi:hypothetical protein
MPEKTKPLDQYPNVSEFNAALGAEVREFLLELVQDDERLGNFVRQRVSFLRESGLSDAAQEFLLDSNFLRIQEVMSQGDQAAVWICTWIC